MKGRGGVVYVQVARQGMVGRGESDVKKKDSV